MFCLTLVQCSSLVCLSWTILSTKMHLHMFPRLKMLCKTMKFLPSYENEEECGVPPAAKQQKVSSPRIPLVCTPPVSCRNASCIIVHCITQGPCVHNAPPPPLSVADTLPPPPPPAPGQRPKKFCVPKIGLKFPAPLMDFIFSRTKNFSGVGGGAVVQPGLARAPNNPPPLGVKRATLVHMRQTGPRPTVQGPVVDQQDSTCHRGWGRGGSDPEEVRAL